MKESPESRVQSRQSKIQGGTYHPNVIIKGQSSGAINDSGLRTLDSGLTRAEKYEKLAFTFCKMGTVGLLAWVLTPPIFVLIVALVAIGLYGKAVMLGLLRSRCFLRKPFLIIGFWAVVAIADASWLIFLR